MCIHLVCNSKDLLFIVIEVSRKMSQVNDPTAPVPPAPINTLPVEILKEIFETYVASYPEVLDRRVVDLCLVGKHWNWVANDTPKLWTDIYLTFPFAEHHLLAASKRVRASKEEKIDIFIDFRDPDPEWDGYEPEYDDIEAADESIWVRNIMGMLKGTERRWKSVEVVSETWLPIYKLMDAWPYTHLPSLRSISVERANPIFGMRRVRFDPIELSRPITLFGRHASLPNLRNLSLSAVHVDWEDVSVSFRNLRMLELNNLTYDVGPSFEQFATILSSSPRLEYLDVSGFCPEHSTAPEPPVGMDPDIPVVHLPVLKECIFGWKEVDHAPSFLEIFQIGSSLENLTLLDTESGIMHRGGRPERDRRWHHDSTPIFQALDRLASAAPEDENDIPPGPFISMRGVKNLWISWTKGSELIPVLEMMEELEDVVLEDIDEGVLSEVTLVASSRARAGRPLENLDIKWMWRPDIPRFAEDLILELQETVINVSARGAEEFVD